MNGRYVDQIIFCSIYALKLLKGDLFGGKDIKFKGMIAVCESLLHFKGEKVKKTRSESGEEIDIISFYNKIYLTPMRLYFKQATNNLPPSASLKNSIPINFINYTPLLKEDKHNNRGILTPLTPISHHLIARETLESPHLQNRNSYLHNSTFFLKNKFPLNTQKLGIAKINPLSLLPPLTITAKTQENTHTPSLHLNNP